MHNDARANVAALVPYLESRREVRGGERLGSERPEVPDCAGVPAQTGEMADSHAQNSDAALAGAVAPDPLSGLVELLQGLTTVLMCPVGMRDQVQAIVDKHSLTPGLYEVRESSVLRDQIISFPLTAVTQWR